MSFKVPMPEMLIWDPISIWMSEPAVTWKVLLPSMTASSPPLVFPAASTPDHGADVPRARYTVTIVLSVAGSSVTMSGTFPGATPAATN